ncbi:MAG TPA: chorismate-binding protein [Sporosarcina sp.]|nr:chorismate-binding protein [Sporosarcina sp.]
MKTIHHTTMQKHGDLLTPVSIFYKLQGQQKCLLESSFVHETKGKYSFIAMNPVQEIIGHQTYTTIRYTKENRSERFEMDALRYLEQVFPKIDVPLPFPFYGGAIGYLSFDSVQTHLSTQDDELNMPDAHFLVYDTVIVYEHRTNLLHLVAFGLNGESIETLDDRLQNVYAQLEYDVPIPSQPENTLQFVPQIPKETFIQQVERAQQLLKTENMQQIVLSQRLIADMTGDAFSFYRHLRAANPSPYMFYIDFGPYLVVGASPESLVHTTGTQVRTNPIAGTRPRGKTAEEDLIIQQSLRTDEKELTEHDMLVALSEQDLQKVCDARTITTPIYKKIEMYEHVMHLVSEVHGTLRAGCSSVDALKTCFPAGTVSGSPRQKAMQLLQALEPQKRGVYAGGIGYFSFNHDLNFAIAIRSLVIRNEKAYLQVGAGIIEQSIPEKEYEETLHKAQSLLNQQNQQAIHQ